MRFIERHVTDKAKPVTQTRIGVVPVVIGDTSRLLSRLHLLEQIGMVAFFGSFALNDTVGKFPFSGNPDRMRAICTIIV